ncbi:MAG: GIY-YIG nuclease family protein [Lachnospiraceae bacterium]|nr:GIY-YIG nuclease family protein [Lachnospiraceae bacterium]
MAQEFFQQRPEVTPTIYAYELPGVASHKGYIKVGYTERDVETRIAEQMHTSAVPYRILLKESAMRSDGSCFLDHDVHAVLRKRGIKQLNAGVDRNEWFHCSVNSVKAAIVAVRDGFANIENRTQTFRMRPEQTVAVQRTIEYFRRAKRDEPDRAPKFLWNAKMRFGKTFASYELAKKMGFTRVLVLTFKPAVESAWMEDLMSHVDFEGWQFISNKDAHNQKINIDQAFQQADAKRPIVVFGSFQDLLGTNENGGIKTKNEFIHTTNWDLVIFDEYHFGAWRENAKKLFENPDEEAEADFDQEKYKLDEADNAYNETFLPITTGYYLFLSGTPFRAINSGEFIEEQIYNWTYSDEQRAKEEWIGSGNPYLSLPRMVMLTYQIPESIRQIAMQGEFNEFDLNVFFSAKVEKGKKIEKARFTYENEVNKWLQLIRGSYLPSNVDDMKLGQDRRPPMPYSDTRLLNVLNHTLWFLPNVAACYAMYNLLMEDRFFRDYKVVVCAGSKAGIGLDALQPVENAMGNPLATRTITLSCGKLTTGVTIKPWTGVFMLRNLKSPETYFQTAFRVQSPWTIMNDRGNQEILKNECYVFDFALDRALRQISDYSCRLNVNEDNPEKKVAEFISFLPVLAYDGSTMKQISAQDVLDIALAGTSATLLARRWESALLVNVDNDTLTRLMNNPAALDALMKIEGFRSLNQDIETIINKSEKVKKAKKEQDKLSKKEKKELTEEEKEYKSLRKQIQEKLIKFATRVPIFMYLTDYRERTLKDVITQLEPGLFKKVTGLDVKDFELLCSIGVFNASLMNDAIFKFKRYEDASLSYTGIDKHAGKDVGGWDTVIKREEYQQLFYNQQATMEYSTPTTEPAIDRESLPTKQIKTAEKTATPTKTKQRIPITTSGRNQESKSQSVTDQHVKKQTSSAFITLKEVPEEDTQKEIDRLTLRVTKGATVKHITFGTGTITRVDKEKKHVRIKFEVGEKLFLFPDAFLKGYLSI